MNNNESYLKIGINRDGHQPNSLVVNYLQNLGYSIKDYSKKIAIDKNGREKGIGKIVANDVNIKKLFDNDPARTGATKTNQMVVISRHPVDIAGMSTDKGWTSCMNLHDGANNHYIPLDIQEGSIIAYLTDNNDKYIKHPSARVLIKPFLSTNRDQYDFRKLNDNKIALGISNIVYGSANNNFLKTVKLWVNNINKSHMLDGLFYQNPELYHDEDGKYDLN